MRPQHSPDAEHAAAANTAAIVVAGGQSTRFGADKLASRIAGRTVLEWVLDALRGCTEIVVAGEPRPLRGVRDDVRFVVEQPPLGGPRAAIAAAMTSIGDEMVWVMAGDQPCIGPALAVLRAALDRATAAPAAVLVDAAGRRRVLAALWRTAALRQRLSELAPHEGGAVRPLYDLDDIVEVTDADDWSADCDTVDQLARLAVRFGAAEH